MAFLHGVEVVEVDAGARPVRTVDTGVIGLVGTAEKGPVNIPTLVAGSRREAVETFGAIGGKGTIPAALAGISPPKRSRRPSGPESPTANRSFPCLRSTPPIRPPGTRPRPACGLSGARR